MTKAEFRNARIALGMTQETFGAFLGLGKRQVQNIEWGVVPVRKPYADLIRMKLENAPGVPPAESGETK